MMEPYYTTELGTLYHGDCLEVMPELDHVDLVLTDPPYGINHSTHGQIFKTSEPIANDNDLWAYDFLASLNKPLCVFFSPYNPPSIKWRSVLAWNKGPQVGGGGDIATCWKRDIEMVGVINNPPLFGKRDSASLYYNALVKKPSGHFCEKPISLMLYLVGKLPGGITVDPFIGSGTTAIACEKQNRKWIGIEISEEYCKIAKERLAQQTLL